MSPAGDLTLPVRHWAPVLVRHREGLPERIGFDPMTTQVRIRGVDPDALEAREIPTKIFDERPPSTIRAYAMDGVLWCRLTRIGSDGNRTAAGLDDAASMLSGAWGMDHSPFRPCIPPSLRLNAYPGDVPIPARTLARASLRLHDVSEARIRDAAAHGVVHDGRSLLVAMPHPLLRYMPKCRVPELDWLGSTDRWSPTFRYDRPYEVAAMQRTMGRYETEIAEDRPLKRSLSEAIAAAMEGIDPRDDDLRHLAVSGPLSIADSLAGYKERERPPAALRMLLELCARASIDAVDIDPQRLPALLRGAMRETSYCINAPELTKLREMTFKINRYLSEIVEPRLVACPVPDEDFEPLDALAP